MKIIIAGKNNIAVNIATWLLAKYEDLELYAIFNRNDIGKDQYQRSFKRYCESNQQIKNITLEEAYTIDDAIFLSLEFDRIINPENFAHQNLFNIHFSLLPKYKGMYTSAWPILNNEASSGVTVHIIDKGIDTGAIIAQHEFGLTSNETARTLYEKYIKFGTELLIQKLPEMISGTIKHYDQSAHFSTYYSRNSIDYSNVKIDLNKTASEIKSQINAFTFRYYQLPRLFGFDIFGCQILQTKSHKKPGILLSESEQNIIISTIDYDLVLFKDNLKRILELCKSGVSDDIVSLGYRPEILFEKNEHGWSPIIVAAYHGNIDMIKWLIRQGCNINDNNNNGTTVAMYLKDYIAKSREFHLFNEIKALGADFSIRDYNGRDLLDYVDASGDKELADAIQRIM